MDLDIETKRLLYVYRWAKSRCTNKNVAQYKDYGGRGIKFLFKSFEEFLEELGPRPAGYSLDRINNDGNYEPGNLRWITTTIQNINQRVQKNNKTGFVGIWFSGNRFHSNLRYEKKTYSFGSFKKIEDAIKARNEFIVENKLIHLYKLQ